MKLMRSGEKVILQWKVMEYVAYVLVFLTPLYFYHKHTFLSFNAPKMILVIGLVLLMTIFYFWGVISSKKLYFKITPIHIVLVLFLLVLTLEAIFSVDPHNSFFGNWSDGLNLILIYAFAIFSLLVGFIIRDNKNFIHRVLLVSFASATIVAFISYFNLKLFTSFGNTIGDNTFAGAYLLINLCFGLYLLIYRLKHISLKEITMIRVMEEGKVNTPKLLPNVKILEEVSIVASLGLIFFSPIILNYYVSLKKFGVYWSDFNTPVIYLMVSLIVGILTGTIRKEWNWEFSSIKKSKNISKILILLCLVFMVLFVFLPRVELVRLSKAMVSTDIKEKAILITRVQYVSLFGGVSDSVDMAENFLDLYKNNTYNINATNRDEYQSQIQLVVNNVEKDMFTEPYDIRAHLVVSKLLNLQMINVGHVDIEKWNESYLNIQKSLALNPNNPDIYLLLSQTQILKEDYSSARLACRQAIVVDPNYVKSYEYARKILVIKPDAKFKKFVDDMAQKWGIGI